MASTIDVRTPAVPRPARPSRSAGRLPSLTGLRFVASLLIFLSHAAQDGSPIPPFKPINPFADDTVDAGFGAIFNNAGYLGVSFFFVLSGFVLTRSTRNQPTGWFLSKRLLRIFPTHVITWGIAMLLFAAAYTPVSTWLLNMFLLQAYSPDPLTIISVNSPSWSLCCTLLFYLLFPVLIRPVLRIPENRLWAWAGVMIAGMFAVVLVTDLLVPASPTSPLLPDISFGQLWSANYFPPSRLFEFGLGMVLARIVAAGRCPRVRVLPAAVLVVLAYTTTLFLPITLQFFAITAAPIALLICAIAMADVRGTWTPLRGRTLQWLGTRSMCFYLAQGIVLYYGRTLVGDNAQYSTTVGILVLLGFLLANIAAGALLYRCVDEPVNRFLSRTRAPKTPASGGNGAVTPLPATG